ncbi:MAG: DegV family protein [Firmicutes bacterium]|nr:DegV family protein [Bacillota bacterium]
MTVYISTESSCDLSPQLLQKHHIKTLPFCVNIGDELFRDGVDIDAAELFRRTEQQKLPVRTAAINEYEYLQHFSSYPADAEVIHISLGSGFSSSCENARRAAVACEGAGITVIDSQNLSSGQGMLVLIAAELAETGKSTAEIAAALEELVPKVEVSFILDTLEYLRRGGRCSSLAALGANILSIHPTIAVVNNSMQVGRKYRGSLKRCIGQYTQAVLQNAAAYDDGHLFITTSGWDEADIAAVRQALAAAGFDAVAVTDAGCTVCAHCGPLCGGIITLRK